MSLIIDCHGHYTTAPKALDDWRHQQIAGIQDPTQMPKAADLNISDTTCATASRPINSS